MEPATLAVPSGAVPVMKTARLTVVTRSLAAVTSVRFILLVLLPSGEYYRWSLPSFNVGSGWTSPAVSLSAQTCPVDGWVVAITTQTATTAFPKGTLFAFQFGLGASDGSEVYRTVQIASDQGLEATWWAGKANDSAFYDPSVPGILYTGVFSQVNGAGTSGNQVYRVTAPAGGRLLIILAKVQNLDASARATTIIVEDGAGNAIATGDSGSLAAGGTFHAPFLGQIPATTGNNPDAKEGIWIAGTDGLTATVAAVGVSQDSAFALIGLCWGGIPTVTLTGPAGSTPTTTTNRLEQG